MHPPAVPLVTHDPYFSVWSMTDKLADNWPRHWSGGTMGMSGLVWVDGKAYRWCGPLPANIPAAEQRRVTVGLTETDYEFQAGNAAFVVTFSSSPRLADDLAAASQSVSTVTFSAAPSGGAVHECRFYLDISGEWCTNDSSDRVTWTRHRAAKMDVVSMGRSEQPVLEHAGDQRKIDWGRVYLGAVGETVVTGHGVSRAAFAQTGHVAANDDLRSPRPANDDWPVLAAAIDVGELKLDEVGRGTIVIGYDEGEAIELFGRKLRPLWHADANAGIGELLTAAKAEVEGEGRAAGFAAQRAFVERAKAVGGERYANLVTLAFRQVMAGHKIVADWDGTPLMFSKENTSNGCIATVDVIYPACPFFLYHNPEMLRAQLRPLMQYAASPRWKFPFAPHDLGTYPKANGQVYGGGERTEDDQMPVEESGNMLIMLAGLVKVEPAEGVKFCGPYLPMLEKWAGYLKEHGLDPANQLCTDDFAGHLARNVNLSAKTVVALGGYAQILKASGRTAEAEKWRAVAEGYAKTWTEMSRQGDATSLVFGDAGKGTWSQKYNLIWDRVLGMNLFPQEVFDREMALYRTKLQKNGLPLDSRKTYTKLDWTVWSACLTGKREDFDAIMAPVLDWANTSPPPSRVPLSDWYETTSGRTMGMHTRTVVGGVWMPLLINKLRDAQ
jgi:hypothetical protein